MPTGHPGGGGGSTTSAGWWEPFLEVGGSLLSSIISNEGADDAADAERQGQERAIQLSRDIYQDQRGLSLPNYLTGGAATNKLASMFGIAPQDYAAAARGGGAGFGGYGGSGGVAPGPENNWGAGQPVAGHSGGGPSGLATSLGSGAGTAIGTAVGGPIGGAIGGALGGAVGGMFRQSGPKGDNWTTLATGAPQGYAYDEYFNSDPGLAREWAKPDVQSLFNGNRDAYIWWHANGGQMNGKQSWAPNTDWIKRGPGQSPTGSPQPAPNALSSSFDMNEFWGSPYGQLATEQFLGADNPMIKGAFATQGKALSGAQQIALSDRGRARAGGAFGDYTNSLRSLAGLNQVAGSAISGAAGTYGANAGQGLIDIGQIGADKTRALNDNWKNFGKNALASYV